LTLPICALSAANRSDRTDHEVIEARLAAPRQRTKEFLGPCRVTVFAMASERQERSARREGRRPVQGALDQSRDDYIVAANRCRCDMRCRKRRESAILTGRERRFENLEVIEHRQRVEPVQIGEQWKSRDRARNSRDRGIYMECGCFHGYA
jgi:hypothetical protein